MQTVEGQGNKQARRPGAVFLSVLGAFVLCLLLQLWHPFYFLGDDNLTAAYPVLQEMGRRLWSGESPAYDPYIFGGVNLLHDAGYLTLFNPISLLVSYLSVTPFRLAQIDIQASVHLLVCAGAFSLMLVRARQSLGLPLSDRRIVFLSLSYTFSAWTLLVTQNWFTFLGNQASFPLIFLGFFTASRRAGIAWTAVGFLYALSTGHLNSLILGLVFLTVFLFSHAVAAKSWEWPLRIALGGLIAVVLTSPLLYFALQGFGQTSRSGIMPVERSSLLAVPVTLFPFSFFGGFLAAPVADYGLFLFRVGLRRPSFSRWLPGACSGRGEPSADSQH